MKIKVTNMIKKTFLIIMVFFIIFNPSSVLAVNNKALIKQFSSSNILYYNPNNNINGCSTSASAGLLDGNTQEEYVWNYLVNANISTNASVIAGIMGNFKRESGYDPFVINSSGYSGIFQAGDFDSVKQKINSEVPGASSMWFTGNIGKTYEGEELEIAKKAINIELNYLLGDDQTNVYAQEFRAFKKNLNIVSNTSGEDGAASYAELFLVLIERAVGGSSQLEDTNIRNFVDTELYPSGSAYHGTLYQEADIRRNYAREIYNQYSSNTTTASGATTSGFDVTIIGDNITYMSGPSIKDLLPEADISATVGRSFQTGITIAKAPTDPNSYSYEKTDVTTIEITPLMLSGELKNNIVFALGSNDTSPYVSEDNLKEIRQITEGKNLYFITNYASADNGENYEPNNTLFKEFAKSNEKVFIIDWATEVQKDENKYLSPDGLHPNEEGQKLFAQLIYNSVIKSTNTNVCSSSGGTWTGDFPYYNQCDERWRDLYTAYEDKGWTYCAAACGPTSFAMMASAILGREILPTEIVGYALEDGNFSGACSGSCYKLTEDLVNKHFSSELEVTTFPIGNTQQTIETMSQYLRDGYMLHISGSGSHPYTSRGHVIGVRGITSDGKWLIADSYDDTFRGGDHTGEIYTLEKEWDPTDIVTGGMGSGRNYAIRKK